jgi:alpha-ketoglutarate-dependent taurine dioxygenase
MIPAVQEVALAQQLNHGTSFPLIYQAEAELQDIDAVAAWVQENQQALLEQLAERGAILFRGLPARSDLDFDRVVQSLGLANFSYAESLSNAVRKNRTERVFTANEAPPEVEIYLHHEMAQTPVYPSKLMFYCELAPSSGGATPLCRSDAVLSVLEERAPEFVRRCEQEGVSYTNVMPASADLASGQGRSWQSTLSVATKAEAETRLSALGYGFEWMADDSLQATTPVLPAIRSLDDGRRVFFNQLIAAFRGWQDARNQARKSVSFGDGQAIEERDMRIVCDAGEEITFDVPWQTGDIALVDNFLVMHGRRPFQGKRRVLASLFA